METPFETRIQQALDGAVPRETLTPGERLELAAMEMAIERALDALPHERVPDLAPAVLARIGSLPVPAVDESVQPTHGDRDGEPRTGGWRAVLDWLWAPRPVALTWRPAYGLALAGLVAVAAAVPWSGEPAVPAASSAERVLVQFRLDAPGASAVALAGDFTEWEPTYVLHRAGHGVWTVVAPLAPGVHHYAFVIDGDRWVPDPMAPAVQDGFGGLNSRVAVITPDVPEQAS